MATTKEEALKDALKTCELEGISPTPYMQKLLERKVRGEITSDELIKLRIEAAKKSA